MASNIYLTFVPGARGRPDAGQGPARIAGGVGGPKLPKQRSHQLHVPQHGRVLHAQTRVESAWLQRLKLQYEATTFNFSFQFQLAPLQHGEHLQFQRLGAGARQ